MRRYRHPCDCSLVEYERITRLTLVSLNPSKETQFRRESIRILEQVPSEHVRDHMGKMDWTRHANLER